MRNNIIKIMVILTIMLFFSTTISPLIKAIIFTDDIDIKSPFPKDDKLVSYDVNYYALVIGIEKFMGVELSEYCIDETASAFYEKLLTGDNWKEENINLLLNENATKNNIQNTISNWLDPIENKNDVVLFYFIGHSYKIPYNIRLKGNAYVFPYDVTDEGFSEDKITDFELDSWLDVLESTHITIILDTFYSGQMLLLKQFGRVVLTSSGKFIPNQEIEDDTIGYGIFSYYFMKGLEGYADNNNDEWISTQEVYLYCRKHCFNYSLSILRNSITNISEIFIPPIPSISNRHFGKIPIMSIAFRWRQLSSNGFGETSNYATRGMTVFKDELYIGTQNNILPYYLGGGNNIWLQFGFLFNYINTIPTEGNYIRIFLRAIWHLLTWASFGCEVWKYNYSTDDLTSVIGRNSISGMNPGFNYTNNAAASVMMEFKGQLYIGTWSTPIGSIQEPNRKGCEIWRSSDGLTWEQVVGDNAPFTNGGFGNPDNVGAWCIEEFNGSLYIGTMNWDITDQGGCEIWRTSDGLHWNQVVDNGFRPLMPIQDRKDGAVNTYAWSMKEF